MIFATISITLALLLYTIGVWGEKLSGGLKVWNLFLFWLGLVFDTIGTMLMERMSVGIHMNLHTLTGFVALVLMALHALWATFVLLKRKHELIAVFHRYSIVVWIVWLIPYFSGMVSHMV